MQTENEGNNTPAEGIAPPSNKQLLLMLARLKLKLIAGYVLDGIVPAVAVIALIVAVMAINDNKSSHAQLARSTALVESLNSSLTASRSELEKLKATMAQEKSNVETGNKKQEERMAKVVQNVSQLQLKMKISPTLDEQLHQPASAPAAASSVTSVSAVPAAVPAKNTTTSSATKKSGSPKQVLTQAIEKFNQKKQK